MKEVVTTLLDKARDTIDVNKARDDGRTPLFIACQNDQQPDMALALVTAKADVHAHDKHGLTPLMAAASGDTCAAVNVLLEHLSISDTDDDESSRRRRLRSYASRVDKRGWTAAHHASDCCLPTLVVAQA